MESISDGAKCLGIPVKGISLVRDFFGYRARGHRDQLSLREQLRLLSGRHLNVNIILVGRENFTTDDLKEIDRAVEIMRTIYAQVNIGVGRVSHFQISEASAQASMIFNSTIAWDPIASWLTNEWTVHNDGVDVFVVRSWLGNTLGLSEFMGLCDKDDDCMMSGVVISIEGNAYTSGITLAHEVGHYLGLNHVVSIYVADPDADGTLVDNVMYPINVSDTQTKLSEGQGVVMNLHCLMRKC